MPMMLDGSCRCGAVRFAVASHTPHPYQLCYCSICRKTGGGGGFAINIMGIAATLKVRGRRTLRVWRATVERDGACETSSGQRHFCARCASALWMFDPQWPDMVYPMASAIDTDLPVPPSRVHMMLRFKASWVRPDIDPQDDCYDEWDPGQSIETWHRDRRLWID